MKKLLLLLFVCPLLFLSSCDKEDDPVEPWKKGDSGKDDPKPTLKDCEKRNISYLDVVNNRKHPYKVYVNGDYQGSLGSNRYYDNIEVKPGKVSIKVVQESGYILYPTIFEDNYPAVQCIEYEFSID